MPPLFWLSVPAYSSSLKTSSMTNLIFSPVVLSIWNLKYGYLGMWVCSFIEFLHLFACSIF